MVKAYLRYELSSSWGVVCSNSNIVYDRSGKYLITSALENVALWNPKQGVLVKTLVPPVSQSGKIAGEVTQIAACPVASQIAAGHSDGVIRVWNLDSGECEATFSGHRHAVTALRYSRSGALLASGSKDTDVVVWDVAAETGLFRLRGHRGQITDVAFIDRLNRLVSSSKDEQVRVWDLDTQHCCQTVVGQRGEVWTLDVDPSQTRLATGSADGELRLYRILADGDEDGQQEAGPPNGAAANGVHQGQKQQQGQLREGEGGEEGGQRRRTGEVLVSMGSVRRQAPERAALVRYSSQAAGEGGGGGVLLTCQSAGKVVEVFRVRTDAEAQKRLKRRRKRRREKAAKTGQQGGGEAAQQDGAVGGADGEEAAAAEETLSAIDELEPLAVVRSKHKLRAFAYGPAPGGGGGARRGAAAGQLAQLVLALVNNSLEVWDVGEGGCEKAQTLDQGGHRSDIRALALSSDDAICLSASNNSVKVWNPRTGACLRSMDSGYGLCALFVPGNRHALVGTKEGWLELFDVATGAQLARVEAHTGAVWSVAALPDGSGFVSGSADHDVKFWEWEVAADAETGAKRLGFAHARTLKMTDDVLCVRVSPNGKLLAVALLDSTIRIFFADSLKFFLSLYGHKLPVLSMDISSDSTLLVSGSADKNLKIWGLDFGDCHRSLFAHGDSVMQVAFVPNTHYVFTAGKDRVVKYWDADKFEQLLALEGHHGEVWCLAVSSLGDFLITGSHDRSLRRWERTDEPFFVEEERERRLESLFEADLEDSGQRGPLRLENGGDATAAGAADEEGSAAPAGRRTLETVSAADNIVEALDMAAAEEDRLQEYQQEQQRGSGAAQAAKPPPPNPLLLGLSPGAYVLRAVGSVRSAELEQALLLLPFTDALRLLGYLVTWLQKGAQVELLCRVASLLVRLHMSQMMATPTARPLLIQLQTLLRQRVQGLKDVMGYNLAALAHLQRQVRERQVGGSSGSIMEPEAAAAAVLPLKRKALAR